MTQTTIEFKLPLMGDDSTRSPGLHLSTLVRELGLYMGVLDKKYEDEEIHAETVNIGIAWEEALCRYVHPEIIFHPEEMHLDGIAMSLDGLSFIEDEASIFRVDGSALHEFKTTRKSINKADRLDLIKLWMWQIMGYLKAIQSQVCFLHVLWLNGDYSYTGKGVPTYRIYKLEFSQQEIDDNWEMLMTWKDQREQTEPKKGAKKKK